jgi:lysozyme
MRNRIKPIVFLVFFTCLGLLMITAKQQENKSFQKLLQTVRKSNPLYNSQTEEEEEKSTDSSEKRIVDIKPIIDVSGWQLPADIDYDTLSENISAVVVRVFGGSNIGFDSIAADASGIDKSYKTHIKEFQKRNVPVAVYAYALGKTEEEMREEAKIFYKASSKYNPTYYWIDIEEQTMSNMNAGVEAFRDELKNLGAKKVGIYIGTYFMKEQNISVDKFDAVWIPTYGNNTGYYDAAPDTTIPYHLHQYTDRGYVNGFGSNLDLNQIAPTQDTLSTFENLFGQKPE